MDSGKEPEEKPQQRGFVGVMKRVAERFLFVLGITLLSLLVAFLGGFASEGDIRGPLWLSMMIVMIVVVHVAAALVWLRRRKSKKTKQVNLMALWRK